tara:strand:+ start:89634 stop:91220 length:1587 start_codon:yes stop_codon:yes gene_type:complete
VELSVLITSAAYVENELVAEFGKLPPAFLPISNRRLFTLQAKVLSGLGGKIYLSLPDSFVIDAHDLDLLRDSRIETIHVPDGLSLASSISYSIDIIRPQGQMCILHGDTVVNEMTAITSDVISVSADVPEYDWAHYKMNRSGLVEEISQSSLDDREQYSGILSGFFSIMHVSDFQEMLKDTLDFVAALDVYTKKYPFQVLDTSRWLDLGHLQTYYRSRATLTTERAFNSLSMDNHHIFKTSADSRKMEAEFLWFQSLPEPLRVYSPRSVYEETRDGQVGYHISYEYLLPLSDVYVFGRLSSREWDGIFESLKTMLSEFRLHSAPDASPVSNDFYKLKTWQRLETYSANTGFDLHKSIKFNGKYVPSLAAIAEELILVLDGAIPLQKSLTHGDLCFSNILFDFRSRKPVVIDPRGYFEEGPTLMGDYRYDLAKLSHSVIGLYDYIVAGYYEIDSKHTHDIKFRLPENIQVSSIQNAFSSVGVFPEEREAEIDAIMILLFVSMLPLHSDSRDRVSAFIANVARLWQLKFE